MKKSPTNSQIKTIIEVLFLCFISLFFVADTGGWDDTEFLLSNLNHTMQVQMLLYIVFIVFATKLIVLYKENKVLRNLNEQVVMELTHIKDASVHILAAMAEYHDTCTGEHVKRVSEYTRILIAGLKECGHFPSYIERPSYMEDVTRASLLHDIGKFAVDKELLAKPRGLTPEEFESVKTHTTIAGTILGDTNREYVEHFGLEDLLELARLIAMHHHEKYDGSGYPFGLAREAIPLSARIVALADVYDALASERPYKKAWPHAKIVTEITRCANKHFDPLVVEAFLLKQDEFAAISSATT